MKSMHKWKKTYEDFKKEKIGNAMRSSIHQDIASQLIDDFSQRSIRRDMYVDFVLDDSYPKKDFESFYEYYVAVYSAEAQEEAIEKKQPSYSYVFQTKEMLKKGFDTKEMLEKGFNGFIRQHLEESIDDFLANKSKEYSNRYDGFLVYLQEHKPDLIDATTEGRIRRVYDERYAIYLKSQDKNEFGLEIKYVDEQLRKIFRWSQIGDGTLLYAWNTSESNGIEKYIKVTQSDMYKNIEPTEKMICEFLFSWWGKNLSSKEEIWNVDVHRQYPKIHAILSKSKTFVELGPGGVDKLLEYLKFYTGEDTIQKFLESKVIKLVDVNAEGYVEIKKKLNKVAERQVSEGIEADFSNKFGSAYLWDQPCYFMFGGSIGNFSFEEIKWILENMKSKEIFKTTNAFITYFTAPDKSKYTSEQYDREIQKIKAMYGDPDRNNPFFNLSANQAVEDLIFSWFKALGIDTSKLEYVVEYEEASWHSPARIKLGAKCKENIQVYGSTARRPFEKKAGEYIRAVQSARFTEEEFKKLAKESGYTIIMQQSDNGVAVAGLQSKMWVHDKYSKSRNIILGVLTGALILSGWLLWHNNYKDKSIKEKILNQEKRLEINRSIVDLGKVNKIKAIQDTIAQECALIYDVWSSSQEDVNNGLMEYLLREDVSNKRLDLLYDNKDDKVIIYNFLQEFVNDFFYKKMFENGAENISVLPFLQWHEKEFLNTLNYQGQTKEGYNAKEGVYYQIMSPGSIYNYRDEKMKWSEDNDLVWWYMVKRTWNLDIWKVDKDRYEYNKRTTQNDISVIELSVSEPDADNMITIKRFVFNDNTENIVNHLNRSEHLIFVNTHEKTGVREHNNLMVDKQVIISFFEKNNPIFKKIRKRYQIIYWEKDKVLMGDKNAQNTKIAMLNDLYRNNQFGIPNMSEYTDEVIDNYVRSFHEKKQKHAKAIDDIMSQNTNIWYPKQTNTLNYEKPDSKPKWFTPWIRKR